MSASEPYTLEAGAVSERWASLTEAANSAHRQRLGTYRIVHRGVVVDQRQPLATEQLRADVTAYLVAHPDAVLYQIAKAVERPEYLPQYGRYLVALSGILEELKHQELPA